MSNINTDGYGSPHMSIQYNGKAVPGTISKWVLVDSEKKDDFLELTIESLDPDLPDEAAFQENSELTILRGYIGGIQGATRKFYVRDIEPNYNEKGLTLCIKCTDKPSMLRQTKAGSKKTFSNKSPKEIVEEIVEGSLINFKFKDDYRDGNLGPLAPFQPRTYLYPLGVPGVDFDISKAKTEAQVLFEASMAKKKQSYAQGNKTDMRAVKELVDDASDVPVVVTGHDDVLYIYPRDLSAPPFRTFKWNADSDLLTFIPETKTRAARSADSHIRYSFPDEATKTVMIGNTTKKDPQNIALNDTIKTTFDPSSPGLVIFPDSTFWNSIRKPEPDIVEIENTGPQVSGTNPFKPQRNNQTYLPGVSQGWVVDNPADSTEANIFFPGTPKSNVSEFYINENGNWTTEVDESRNKFNGATIVKKEIVIDGSEDAPNQARKKLEEDTFELNEGSATIICDPRIVSGMILSFENVSKKYSGKYYIVETKETSDGRGYIMELVISRNAEGTIDNAPGNVVPAKNAGVPVNNNNTPTSNTGEEPKVSTPTQSSTTPQKPKTKRNWLGIRED